MSLQHCKFSAVSRPTKSPCFQFLSRGRYMPYCRLQSKPPAEAIMTLLSLSTDQHASFEEKKTMDSAPLVHTSVSKSR